MFIQVNNTKLYYEEYGKGEVIIFLHGNGEDSKIFYKLKNKLKNNYRCILLDTRFHGKSEKKTINNYSDLKKDLKKFIEKKNLKDINLLGFSDGAITSLLLALEDQAKIKSLILIGVGLSPKDFKEEELEKIEKEYKNTNDPLLKLMLNGPNISLESLKDIIIKTLIIAGENDCYKEEIYVDINKNIKNSKLKIMKGHNHDSYVINSDILYKDIIEFLNN